MSPQRSCVCVSVRLVLVNTLHDVVWHVSVAVSQSITIAPGELGIICHHFMCHTLSWQPAPLPLLPSMTGSEEIESPMSKIFKLNRDFNPLSLVVLALYSISPTASAWFHYSAVVPICNPIHRGSGVITMILFEYADVALTVVEAALWPTVLIDVFLITMLIVSCAWAWFCYSLSPSSVSFLVPLSDSSFWLQFGLVVRRMWIIGEQGEEWGAWHNQLLPTQGSSTNVIQTDKNTSWAEGNSRWPGINTAQQNEQCVFYYLDR